MARTLHWIDGASGRRYSHEWPMGVNGALPWGNGFSAEGYRAGVVPNPPYFGQAIAGQRSNMWGLITHGMPHNPTSQTFTWFQAGYWFKLDSPPSGSERYHCHRTPYFFNTADHPNANKTYTTHGWGVYNASPHINEIYFAYGSTYPTKFQWSGVIWPGFSPGQWYWIEFRVGIATGTTGVFELRIDGEQITRMTSIRTYEGTATVANAWLSDIQDLSGWALDQKTDDEYIMTGTSEGDLAFLGLSAIETLIPNGNGAQNDFEVVNESSNFRGVKQTPYSDASYVRLTGNGAAVDEARELYTFDNVDTTRIRTLHGVKVTYRGRRQNTNAVRVKPIVRLGATIYYGANGDDWLGPEYKEYYYVWEKNPATSNPWTAEEVNGAQFGFEVATS